MGGMEHIIEQVRIERQAQNEKWGDQTHPETGRDFMEWVSILTEEVGELAQAALQVRFEKGSLSRITAEAVQVAAVAVAIVESVDRRIITEEG